MLVHSPEEPPIPPSDAADCRLNCMRAVAATVHTKTDLLVLSFAALSANLARHRRVKSLPERVRVFRDPLAKAQGRHSVKG